MTQGPTTCRHADPGYADALVSLIGTPLSAVDEMLDLGLVLDFACGARLAVPLDGSGLDGGAEIAAYADDEHLLVWRPGEPPIRWGSSTVG